MFSTSFTSRVLAAAVFAATVGCADSSLPTSPNVAIAGDGQPALLSEGLGAFHRYAAIGTSLSMGVASDGTIEASQEQSWPAQLARMAHREITQPIIGGTGCRSPLRAPLTSGVRISGEAAGANQASLSCAPLKSGEVSLVQNVAINGATTFNALFTTPENVPNTGNKQITERVLLPGHTQISSLEEQNPKFVSVEFGANELLGVRSGIAIEDEGGTMFPYSVWAPLYTQLVDRAAAATKYGLIVGLIHDVATIPGFRRGSELYTDRNTFAAAFNVTVAGDCNGSTNLIFTPVVVPTAVARGAAMGTTGRYVLSCAGAGPTTQDFILTPDEVARVNTLASRMTAYMKAESERVGFAYFELDELFRADFKPTFSVVQLMTSTTQPYGPYSSFDGVHPSALGQRVVAEAAARAIDVRYNFGLTAQLIASR